MDNETLSAAIDAALRQVPPLWPLSATVAVNPFLGQAGESLAATGARLARVAGAPVKMPRGWYRERIASGMIRDDDLAAALAASPHANAPATVEALRETAKKDRATPEALPTVADLAAKASGIDWSGIVAERIGIWAGGYVDEGQALWTMPREGGAWAAWRAWATHDLTPEIRGLKGFAADAYATTADAGASIAASLASLGVPEEGVASYLHRLLFTLGGWAQLARGTLWRAEMAGETDHDLRDLLAIRLFWEAALHGQYRNGIAEGWTAALVRYAEPAAPTADDVLDEILQDAADRAEQRRLAEALAAPAARHGDGDRPALQAAFCIDVRSEVFRRALEAVDPGVQTLGFAGFFGIGAEHRAFASDTPEHRLPVLLNPGLASRAGGDTAAVQEARYSARAKRAWGRFRQAAVSSFAFVEAAGPVYLGRLLRDALGGGSEAKADPAPVLDPAPDLDARIGAAETVLRAMSLTDGFARLVLLAGHGASVTNNPFSSALQCGACGGHSGEVNARLLAALLNEQAVREGVASRGIAIPQDTLFVAALHDTTTDAVTLFDGDAPSTDHVGDLRKARLLLAEAGRIARAERRPALPGADAPHALLDRARDWAELRPEWGLAGCNAFIAAPRSRTAGKALSGRAFLHDYDWRQDEPNGFKVLELILTAPVVVASWISLQYYGSTVAPEVFGSGDKTLHNVVGGVGVFEGNGGVLRAGLPLQSVHDGTRFMHEPLRLAVHVEAPVEAITAILDRHPSVRALFDNRWLHLLALDATGAVAARYAGDLHWQEAGAPVLAAA